MVEKIVFFWTRSILKCCKWLNMSLKTQPCSSPPSGYVGGAHYKMFGGNNWVSNVLLTAALFCGPVIPAFAFLNTVAIFYGSMVALPFGTIVIIVVIWLVVTFPLTVLGGIAAKNGKGEFNAPCRWGWVCG